MAGISSDTLNRLMVGLTSPAAANEVLGQLTTPTFSSVNITGPLVKSASEGIVARSGGGQALAAALPSTINRVTTVAAIGDSVILPKAVAGAEINVINAGANSMNVFPFLGDAINSLGANAAFALATTKVCTFFCTVAGVWHTQISA